MWNSAFLPDLVFTQPKKWSVFSSLTVCDDLRHSDCGLTHDHITPVMICNIVALPNMWYCLINGERGVQRKHGRKMDGEKSERKRGQSSQLVGRFWKRGRRSSCSLPIPHRTPRWLSEGKHKQLYYSFTVWKMGKLNFLWIRRDFMTLKYMGAISPSSRGSGTHSSTMCRRWRGLMYVSINTQSRSWDSNIRTRARRNSWGQQSSTEGNPNLTKKKSFVSVVSLSKLRRDIKTHESSPEFLSRRPHPVQWQSSGAGEDRWDSVPLSSILQQEGSGTPGHSTRNTLQKNKK